MPRKSPAIRDSDEILSVNEQNGIYIDSQTAVTRWRGEKMDYDMALCCLFQQRNLHRERQRESSPNVSAETPEMEQFTEQDLYGWTFQPLN